jgi:hypothetical protein
MSRANPLKCAGQGTIVIASGRRGRGFESRHPDSLKYEVSGLRCMAS